MGALPLNPDFGAPGTQILVVLPQNPDFGAPRTQILVPPELRSAPEVIFVPLGFCTPTERHFR